MRQLLFSCLIAGGFMVGAVGGNAYAHHTTPGKMHTSAMIRISQPVLAEGKLLTPGTYEVIITDEHPALPDGTPSQHQRWVELLHDGTVVAREIAEVFTAGERPVGTSGSSAASAVVQRLRGDEFVRIAVSAGASRYLIHLSTGRPATQP
jgi:hypothetical protein